MAESGRSLSGCANRITEFTSMTAALCFVVGGGTALEGVEQLLALAVGALFFIAAKLCEVIEAIRGYDT